MHKEAIIAEIKRTAKDNAGVPLGAGKFEKLTGIKRYIWFGKYWRSWGDALQEAGFLPNRFGAEAYSNLFLIESLTKLTQALGRFPAKADILIAKSNNSDFPSSNTFDKNLGTQSQKIIHVRKFANENPEF